MAFANYGYGCRVGSEYRQHRHCDDGEDMLLPIMLRFSVALAVVLPFADCCAWPMRCWMPPPSPWPPEDKRATADEDQEAMIDAVALASRVSMSRRRRSCARQGAPHEVGYFAAGFVASLLPRCFGGLAFMG